MLQLALKYHPDQNKNDKTATDKLTELNGAYEVRSSVFFFLLAGLGRKRSLATRRKRSNSISLVLRPSIPIWEVGLRVSRAAFRASRALDSIWVAEEVPLSSLS